MKYQITEVQPFGMGTRVFRVKTDTWLGTDVWWDGRFARCCHCSTPLAAMSACCIHAKAVRRHLARIESAKALTAPPQQGR